MIDWSLKHDIELHFTDPGKPAQNAWIESFNARARDQFFNLHLFRTLDEKRIAGAEWLQDYNEVRPHSSLNYLTPREFAARLRTAVAPQESVA